VVTTLFVCDAVTGDPLCGQTHEERSRRRVEPSKILAREQPWAGVVGVPPSATFGLLLLELTLMIQLDIKLLESEAGKYSNDVERDANSVRSSP
jgi:hypothetical protein